MANASSRSSSHRALRTRDAGLRRISLTTRALVVGSVAAAGFFSSLAAWAQPGRSKAVPATKPIAGGQLGYGSGTSAATTPATTPATTAPASDDGGNLSQPASPPVTAPAPAPAPTAPAYQYTPPPQQYVPPVVVSGAS
jgi:hypothetical protein